MISPLIEKIVGNTRWSAQLRPISTRSKNVEIVVWEAKNGDKKSDRKM
jgi:hypothetical protein